MENAQFILVPTSNRPVPTKDVPILRRKRYFVAFMVFIGGNILSLLRSTLPIAIVEMTATKNVTVGDKMVEQEAELNWNSFEKGLLLGSHFSLGLLSCFGGYISSKYGGVRTFGVSIFFCGTLSLVWPLSIHFTLPLLLAIRMLEGVFFSLACTSCIEIFIRWIPFRERFRIIDFSISGLFVGPILCFPVCGLILENFGWRYVFYFAGVTTILWSIIWATCIYEHPCEDKLILAKEKCFLKENIEALPEKLLYPWRAILTSKAVWAFLNERFVEGWSLSFALDCLPLFIRDSFNVSISDIGFISVAPHTCNFLGLVSGALVGDYLRNRNVATLPKIYTTLITIGQLTCVVLFIIMGLWTNFMGSIFCMCLLRFMYGCSESAYTVMPIDIAGEYASIIQGVGVSMQTIGFLLNPIFLGLIVSNHNSEEWSRYFLFLSAFNVWGATIFFFYGSGCPEPWTEAGKKAKNHSDNEVMEEDNS